MIVIKPSYKIINEPDWDKLAAGIEEVARTCYQSHDRTKEGSADIMIRNLISRQHEAMLEFADMTVRFTCDRGVSHELVRHRHCSFAQESTRYVKYDGEMEFVLPCWVGEKFLGPCSGAKLVFDNPEDIWIMTCKNIEVEYKSLLRHGWAPQQARSILPNSLKTKINMKTNIRDWRHILSLRCDKTAHPQMRELMIPLYNELVEKCPVIFDSVEFS